MRNSRAPAGFQPKGWPFGLQRRSRLGTFEPMRNSRAPAGFQPKGWPFGLQRRSRLGTFEPAKSMEVSALGNPCETAQPQQDSGSMGGRLVCRADLVWAPSNPLKAWRVERYPRHVFVQDYPVHGSIRTSVGPEMVKCHFPKTSRKFSL